MFAALKTFPQPVLCLPLLLDINGTLFFKASSVPDVLIVVRRQNPGVHLFRSFVADSEFLWSHLITPVPDFASKIVSIKFTSPSSSALLRTAVTSLRDNCRGESILKAMYRLLTVRTSLRPPSPPIFGVSS